jgi:hypothetical protein
MALGAMVPGPTTALVVRRSAVDGIRAAVPLVLGIETGLYTWVIVSALGVAAVVAASETAYTVSEPEYSCCSVFKRGWRVAGSAWSPRPLPSLSLPAAGGEPPRPEP